MAQQATVHEVLGEKPGKAIKVAVLCTNVHDFNYFCKNTLQTMLEQARGKAFYMVSESDYADSMNWEYYYRLGKQTEELQKIWHGLYCRNVKVFQ